MDLPISSLNKIHFIIDLIIWKLKSTCSPKTNNHTNKSFK